MNTSSTPAQPNCELCQTPFSPTLAVWQDDFCRIMRVDDLDYPGYCRVIVHAHIREMSDLSPEQQIHLLRVVLATETALRQLMQPDKINLASLGNLVPHLHWHVIPRWQDDAHFPQPIWGERASPPQKPLRPRPLLTHSALAQAIQAQLGASSERKNI